MANGLNNEVKARKYILPWVFASIGSAALVFFLAPWLIPLKLSATAPQNGGEGDLFDIVREVRADVIRLQSELIQKQETAVFQIESVDVELSFVVKQDASVDVEGGATKLLVVGADSTYGTEQIQKIFVHMSLAEPGEPNIVIEGIPLDVDNAIPLD